MSRLAVALFVLACCFTASLSAAEPCPTGWKFNSANNHCYNLEATASPVTWVQAKAACAAYNARTKLVSLGDQTENDYVYNYVKTEKAYNGNIWIGLEANDAYPVSGNETCSNAVVVPVLGRKFSGSITTGTGTVDPYSDCDMPGKENFFRITPAVSGTWTFKVYSAFDAVIDLYSGACTSFIDCEDYNGANATDTMTYSLTAGQTYTVVVDKYKTTDSGTYTLEIMAPTDNGKRAFSWIDDTNNGYTNWDSGEPSNSAGNEACGELKIGSTTYGKWNDLPCNSSSALHAYVCEYISSVCGDNVVEGIEECDDGNLTDNDGCDANCRPTGCGNGRVTGTEQCDDGNVIDLDACNNDCTYPCPTGWAYNTATGKCYNLYGVGATKTWTESKDVCPTTYGNNTTLATLGTQAENDFVYNYVKYTKAYNGNTWIGLDGVTATAVSGNESCSTAWIAPGMGRKYSGYIGAGTGTVDPYGDCDMPGKENFFRFTAAVSGTWTFKVYSAFDAVIDLYSGSCGSYLDCEDYNYANATDTMTYSLTAGQTYTVVVDKYSTSDYGAYTLDIMPPSDRGVNAYVWIDGTDSTYTNWDSNEPTGATEACGELKIATTTNNKWNDLACNSSSVKLVYTCETPGDILAMTNKTAITTLDLSNRGLTSLDGIEAFTNLHVLNVSNNNLITLDGLQGCAALTEINISGNAIDSLSVLYSLQDLVKVTLTDTEDNSIIVIERSYGETLASFLGRISVPIFWIKDYHELASLLVRYSFDNRASTQYEPNLAPCGSGTNVPTCGLWYGRDETGMEYADSPVPSSNSSSYLINDALDYIRISAKDTTYTDLPLSDDLTFSLWFHTTNTAQPIQTLLGRYCLGEPEYCDVYPQKKIFEVSYDTGKIIVTKVTSAWTTEDHDFDVSGIASRISGWHHVGIELIDHSYLKIFFNGVLVGSPYNIGDVSGPTDPAAIKRYLIGKPATAVLIDEFRVHKGTLDLNEIQDLYYGFSCPIGYSRDMVYPEMCVMCGDGEIEGSEICDDGSTLNGTYGHCSTDCTGQGPNCGDSLVSNGENCDIAKTGTNYGSATIDCQTYNASYYTGANATCNTGCFSGYNVSACKYCGDGTVSNGENCDTTKTGSAYGAATIDCQTYNASYYTGADASCNTGCNAGYNIANCRWCGDGQVSNSEACDTSGTTATVNCTTRSHSPAYWNTGDNATCASGCGSYSETNCKYCGDGIYTPAFENCDTTKTGSTYGSATIDCNTYSSSYYTGDNATCNNGCNAGYNIAACRWCGDGQVTNDENCDDGVNDGTYGHCKAGCQSGMAAYCGDGTVNGSEVCDDGVNDGSYDGCMAGCVAVGPHCGDGVAQSANETCDGTDLSSQTCTTQVSGATGGTLSCNGGCSAFVTTACTKTYTCNAKPATGTVWNTVSSYNQTWSGTAWVPADDDTTEYNATGSSTACRYACDTNYIYEEGACIHSKQVNCTLPVDTNYKVIDDETMVTITYTSGIGWSDPDECPWVCDTNYDRDGEACIDEKTVVNCYASSELLHVYNEQSQTLHFTTEHGWRLEWNGNVVEYSRTDDYLDGNDTWSPIGQCPCIAGTYRSQAGEPLTECIPYGAIDFQDKDLHLCLRRFIPWGENIDHTTRYYLTPEELDDPWLFLVDCSYDPDNTLYNTKEVPGYQPETIGKIQSLRGIEYMTNLQELYLSGNAVHDLKPLTKLSENSFYGLHYEKSYCEQATPITHMMPFSYDLSKPCPDVACDAVKSECINFDAGLYISYSATNIFNIDDPHEIFCLDRVDGAQEPSHVFLTGAENESVYEKQLYLSEMSCETGTTPTRLLFGFLKDPSAWSANPPALEVLDLGDNVLSADSLEGLDKLTQLKYLVLSGNSLHGLSQGAFFGLNNLTALDLSHNGMDDTDILTLKDTPGLIYLYLAGNQIGNPNSSLGETEEDCTCTESGCSSVYNLCLCSESSGTCSELTPRQHDFLLNHLINLERLDLGDNPLTTIWGVPVLTKLRSLDIGLSDTFSGDSNMISLTLLRHADTQGYPEFLEYLDLSNRRTGTGSFVVDIEPLQDISSLRYLVLHQKLTTPQTAPAQLSDESDLEAFINLRTLDISGLRVGSLDMLEEMPNLQVLIAENACITDPEPLLTHEMVGYARLANNCIPATDKLTSLLNEHIIGDDSLSQREPNLCNTVCTTYKICAFTPTPETIACSLYDARYGSGTAYCNEDGFSYDVSGCVELETPDDDSLLTDDPLTDEDTLLDDTDDMGSAGSSGDDADIPRSAQCKLVSGVLPRSYNNQPYCRCGEGSHAVYYNISDETTWRCVRDQEEDIASAMDVDDPSTLDCINSSENLTTTETANIPWCLDGKCRSTTDNDTIFEWCYVDRFIQSPCYRAYRDDCERIRNLPANAFQSDTNVVTSSNPAERKYAALQQVKGVLTEEVIGPDGKAVRYIDLPEPAMSGYGSHSTFVGHMNRAQAVIQNFIRPVNLKFKELSDAVVYPGDPYMSSDMFGLTADIRNIGAVQYYGEGSLENVALHKVTMVPESVSTANIVYVPGTYTSVTNVGMLDLQGLQSIELVGGETSLQDTIQNAFTNRLPAAPVSISAEALFQTNRSIFSKVLAKMQVNLIPRADWSPTEPIRSCEQYVYQKYFDFTRSMDILAAYEKYPEEFMGMLFNNDEAYWPESFGEEVISFAELGTGNQLSAANKRDRFGDYRNITCHPLFGSNTKCYVLSANDIWQEYSNLDGSDILRLTKGKNLFWEVIYQIDQKQESLKDDEGRPHIVNGMLRNIATTLSLGTTDVLLGAPDYQRADLQYYKTQAADYQSDIADDESALEQLKYSKKLKDRLLQLLKYRANAEILWNEKREFVKQFQHGSLPKFPNDGPINYDVAEITPAATTLLKNLSIYKPTVTKLEEILDPKIRAMYNPATNGTAVAYLETVEAATEVEREQLWKTVEADIRDNRFLETEKAQKLWSRYHYGKDAYQNEHAAPGEAYVRGDTEELLEQVLEEIDDRIEWTLQQAAGDLVITPVDAAGTEGTSITLDCLNTTSTTTTPCDLDAESFADQLPTLIPPTAMERDYKKCMDYFRSDAAIFSSNLTDVPEFTVFHPEWAAVYGGVYPGYENMAMGTLYTRAKGEGSTLPPSVVTRLGETIEAYWNFEYQNTFGLEEITSSYYRGKSVSGVSGSEMDFSPYTSDIENQTTGIGIASGALILKGGLALSELWTWSGDTIPNAVKNSFTIDMYLTPGDCATLTDTDTTNEVYRSIFSKSIGSDNNDNVKFEIGCAKFSSQESPKLFVRMNSPLHNGQTISMLNQIDETVIDERPLPPLPGTNDFMHLVVVVEEQSSGSKITIYRNGIKTGEGNVDTKFTDPVHESNTDGHYFVIGALYNGDGNYDHKWAGRMKRLTIYKQATHETGSLAAERDARFALSFDLAQEDIYNVQAFVDAYTAFKKDPPEEVSTDTTHNPKSTKERAIDLGVHFGDNNATDYVAATLFHYGANLCDLKMDGSVLKCYNAETESWNAYDSSSVGAIQAETGSRCFNSGSNTTWPADFTDKGARCLEAYIMLNDAWRAEQGTITRRVKEVTKQLAENKEKLKVAQLARVMQMEPSAPGTQTTTQKKKRKDSIKKYFSEYETIRNNKCVGIEYSYIAGGGIYQIDVDWDKLNPIPDLRKFEPLVAQVLNELITTLCVIGTDPDTEFTDEEVAACRMIDPQTFVDDPALMAQLYREVMEGLKEVPTCMLYENEAGREARRLITAVQKFINMFKGFNPNRMKKGAMSMLPDVDPEDFLYALAERVVKQALQNALSTTGAYETVARAQSVQKAIQNDVAKVKGQVKQVGEMVSTIKELIEGLKSGNLTGTITSAEAEALSKEVFGLMAQEVLIDFITMNVKVTFNGTIPEGLPDKPTLEKQFMMNRELVENLIKNAKPLTFDTSGALSCGTNCDPLLKLFYDLTKNPYDANSGFATWFSGAIGGDNVRDKIITTIQTVIKNPNDPAKYFNYQNVLEMARSIPIPQWTTINSSMYSELLDPDGHIGSNTTFAQTLFSQIQTQVARSVSDAYQNSGSLSITITYSATGSSNLTLPSINLSLVQRALMRLLERKANQFQASFQDKFATLTTALNTITAGDISTLVNDEFETIAAINDLQNSSITLDAGDLSTALTAALSNSMLDIPTLMEIYISAVAEQFNFEVLNEILSGNFDYKSFIEDSLDYCIQTHVENREIKSEALKTALNCTGTCTLGSRVDSLEAVVEGIGNVAENPEILKDRAKDLGMSLMNGVMARMTEIIIEKLMMLPYGEFVMHSRADVEYFNSKENIFEATNFISTRFPQSVLPDDDPKCTGPSGDPALCQYARLDGAKQKARNWFLDHTKDTNGNTKLKQFELYQKFYAKSINLGIEDAILDIVKQKLLEVTGIEGLLDDLLPEEVSMILAAYGSGDYKKIAEVAANEAGLDLEKVQKDIEKALVDAQKEIMALVEKAQSEGGLAFGDPESTENSTGAGDNPEEWGEKHSLVDLPYEDSYWNMIGIVPVMLQWGVHLTVDVYLKYYADYGMVANDAKGGQQTLGLTAGLGVTPHVKCDGYIAGGLGLDLGFVGFFLGVEGNIMFVNFRAPLRIQALLGAEFADGDLAAKLYLNASLTPKLTLFDASLKVKVQAQVIGIPVTYRKTFANFKPLIDRDYGNIIPIKPLDLNLFTLGQIMNAMQ